LHSLSRPSAESDRRCIVSDDWIPGVIQEYAPSPLFFLHSWPQIRGSQSFCTAHFQTSGDFSGYFSNSRINLGAWARCMIECPFSHLQSSTLACGAVSIGGRIFDLTIRYLPGCSSSRVFALRHPHPPRESERPPVVTSIICYAAANHDPLLLLR
jgi:hypothetical protein